MLPEVESLIVRVCGFLKKALLSREEPDISSSIVKSKHAFILACYTRIISLKRGSALKTCSNDFIRSIVNA